MKVLPVLWPRNTLLKKQSQLYKSHRHIARAFASIPTRLSASPLSILFFGSDNFSVACLRGLLEEKERKDGTEPSVVGHMEVVTPAGAAVGKAPLHQFASKAGLKCYEAPPKTLTGWQPPTLANLLPFDLAVVVSFGYFLPAPLIASFPRGGLNVHPSLLPKYRGAAPIQHTLINGDPVTGVSIIELHAQRFDAGRILNQSQMNVPPAISYKDLHDKLAHEGARLLISTLRNLDTCSSTAKPQPDTGVTKAPKITKQMARIEWDNWTAEEVLRRYRGIGHQEPLHTTLKGTPVQIKDMLPLEEAGTPPPDSITADPGTIFYVKPANVIWVRARQGWVPCTLFHPEYKKESTAPNFKNGYRLVSLSDRFV